MTNTTRKAAVYCRISKKVEHIPKVEDQEAMCRDLAKRNDLEVVKVYVDDGISASKFLDRPGWAELLEDVAAGGIDVLLAQSEDRFSRQPMEKETLAVASAANGVTWLTVQEGSTDPSTADGEFFAGMRALMHRWYAKGKNEKHREANELARLRGEPARGGDRRPFGYEPDKSTLREVEAERIRDAYAGIIDGTLTPTRIAHRWNKAGVKTSRADPLTAEELGRQAKGEKVRKVTLGQWDTAKVTALLRRPRNAAWVTHEGERVLDGNGEPVRARWEPIVDDETFVAANKILDGRKGGRQHEPKWLCSGLVTCATCGTPLASNTSARGTKYRCRTFSNGASSDGGHVEITAKILDEVVAREAVAAVLFAPRSGVADPDAERLGGLRTRLVDVRKAERDLLDLVGTGAFDLAEVAGKKRALSVEAEAIEDEVAAIGARNARAALLADVQGMLRQKTPLSDAAKDRAVIRERFDAMPLDQKRALVKGTLKVEVTAGGRGAERVRVQHLVATGLNDAQDVEDK